MMTHADSAPSVSQQRPTLELLWPTIKQQAENLQKSEPALSSLVHSNILREADFSAALCRVLSGKLASADVSATQLHEIFIKAHQAAPAMAKAAQHDILSIISHDPVVRDVVTPFLFFKGFHALQTHRVAHWLWSQDRSHMALHLQSRASELFGIDIHPAAKIGQGVMMDHGTGIVIGETSVVEDDVLFWHGVTLGGRTMQVGDRHPKIRKGAQLSSCCMVLGAIEIGAGAKVAAGSVVLDNVPAGATAVGVPAKVVGKG